MSYHKFLQIFIRTHPYHCIFNTRGDCCYIQSMSYIYALVLQYKLYNQPKVRINIMTFQAPTEKSYSFRPCSIKIRSCLDPQI